MICLEQNMKVLLNVTSTFGIIQIVLETYVSLQLIKDFNHFITLSK